MVSKIEETRYGIENKGIIRYSFASVNPLLACWRVNSGRSQWAAANCSRELRRSIGCAGWTGAGAVGVSTFAFESEVLRSAVVFVVLGHLTKPFLATDCLH